MKMCRKMRRLVQFLQPHKVYFTRATNIFGFRLFSKKKVRFEVPLYGYKMLWFFRFGLKFFHTTEIIERVQVSFRCGSHLSTKKTRFWAGLGSEEPDFMFHQVLQTGFFCA